MPALSRGDGAAGRLRPDGGAPRGRPAVPPGAAVALLGPTAPGRRRCSRPSRAPAGPGGPRAVPGSPVERRRRQCPARAGLCLIPEGRGSSAASRCGRTSPCRSADATSTARWRRPPPASPSSPAMDQVAGTRAGGEQQMLASPGPSSPTPRGLADELSVGWRRSSSTRSRGAGRAAGRGTVAAPGGAVCGTGRRIADYVYILQKGQIVFVGNRSQCASGVVFAR